MKHTTAYMGFWSNCTELSWEHGASVLGARVQRSTFDTELSATNPHVYNCCRIPKVIYLTFRHFKTGSVYKVLQWSIVIWLAFVFFRSLSDNQNQQRTSNKITNCSCVMSHIITQWFAEPQKQKWCYKSGIVTWYFA